MVKPYAWSSSQVDNLLLVVMQSAHLIIQRKAFQQSIEGLMTLRQEQTSSQPIIAKALQQLKVFHRQACVSCIYTEYSERRISVLSLSVPPGS